MEPTSGADRNVELYKATQGSGEGQASCISEFEDTIDACRFCLMCRHLCTVGNQLLVESVTPRGRALNLDAVRKGLLRYDSDVADIIYRCSLCELCKVSCVGRYDMPGLVRAGRADLVSRNLAPLGVKKIKDSILSGENPLAGPREARFQSVVQELQHLPEQAEVLIFAGCASTYLRPSMLRAAVRVVEAAGIGFTIMRDEGCCGLPLYDLGFREEARRWASKTAESIDRTGCTNLVTLCPSCLFAFDQIYPRLGVSLNSRVEVAHLSEFLLYLVTAGAVKTRPGQRRLVTYHDPCCLGRISNKYDAPRHVINELPDVELKEMYWNRDMAHCCGGGLIHIAYPKVGEQIAHSRADEAAETGAEILVSACPTCESVLAKEISAAGKSLIVMDLVELVGARL
ncbi:MAG: (Fe-S)-binding protein [Bacillota bacterium]